MKYLIWLALFLLSMASAADDVISIDKMTKAYSPSDYRLRGNIQVRCDKDKLPGLRMFSEATFTTNEVLVGHTVYIFQWTDSKAIMSVPIAACILIVTE